ncbi:MAG TPA: TolC family protein [Vicinamibacteria bacterium]|nr:TolC family protein [Vicinamibacteria bacterium]
MNRLPLFALLVVLAAAPAAAEPLSRAQAVARALERNPTVLRSFADRDGLRGRARQARADALPEVSVYGTFLRYQDPGFFNSPNIDEFPPEILQAFRPIASNLWDGSVSVRQTLWSFSLGKAIRAAGYAQHLGDENVRTARQDVALRAIFAYNAYLLALEQVGVAEKVVHQKERQLEMSRNRRGAGVSTELDVLRFEVDLANVRTSLLRLRGAADLALGDLNAVMVEPTDKPIEPTDGLEFQETAPDEAVQQQVVREAIASRPEVKAVTWNEKIYDEAIGIYKADMQPRLDFNGAYGWSVRDTGNFFESNYKKWSLAVTLKIPVFDGWRTAGKVAQARADRAKVGQDRVAIETQIDLEAKQAVDRLRVAASVFHAAELNVAQARKATEMTDANYRLGAATLLDVLDAQAALTQAEFVRVEALHAHANARVGLRYVTGRDPLADGAAAPHPPSPTTTDTPTTAEAGLPAAGRE